MKKYFKAAVENEKYNVVKFEVYYSKGGYNYFTYKTDKRGYWLSIAPINISNHIDSKGIPYQIERQECMSGRRVFLLEVSRKSVGKETEAVNMVLNDFAKYKQMAEDQLGLKFTDEEVR